MNEIAALRKKLGITQAELAKKLNWSQSRIGNYESGIRTPDLISSRQIVIALNQLGCECSLDKVFPPKQNAA